MPESEPIPGAPESIWAGEQDAQLFFTQIGMPWLAPFAAPFRPRIVHTAELCSAGPPAVSPITLSDVLASRFDNEAGQAAQLKMNTWVDRGLWEGNCRFVDDTVPPPIVPQPPPEGLPEGPPPETAGDKLHREMHAWLEWWVRNALPRPAVLKHEFICSDQGFEALPQDTTGQWPVYATGIDVVVTAKPDYAGRSNGGDFPVFYDLGWMSLSSVGGGQPPHRLAHEHLVISGSNPMVTGFYWNLPPGVTVTVKALYPTTPVMPPGG